MIPVRLELKNFMAYRDAPPLDLSGLHLVCLTGENGAGKSTLLDAITWALWGEARSRRDDELISQSESEMRVGFTYIEGPETYQVVRTRKLGKAVKGKPPASTGTLDFLIQDKGTWRTLSEGRQAETQQRIIESLKLSYDTFINSAFLKQGRADEFTLKTPAERKALLAEILNLDRWVEYETMVKVQQTEVERKEELLQFDLKQAEDEIERLPVYERELDTAQKSAHDASLILASADVELGEIERQRERSKMFRGQRTQIEERLKSLQNDLDNLTAERARHQSSLDEYQSAINQREDIEQGHAAYVEAVKANEAFNLKLANLVELNSRKTGAETRIADVRRKLESERDAAQRLLSELQKQSDSGGLLEQANQLNAQLKALNDQKTAREAMMQSVVESREQQADVKARNAELKRKMNDLKSRINTLADIGAVCPTCGRELAEHDRTHILDEWNDQGHVMGDDYRAGEEKLKELTTLRMTLETQIANADRSLTKETSLHREFAGIEERIKRSQEACAKLPEAKIALEKVAQILTTEQYAEDARKSLSGVTRELEELGYDDKAHRHLRDVQLPRLQPYVDRKTKLDRAEMGITSEQRALETIVLREVALAEKRTTEANERIRLLSEIEACEAALQHAPEIEARVNAARNEFYAAQRKVGEANQRVQSCHALEVKRDRLMEDLNACTAQKGILAELRMAFGKNGVPAMIIDSILPQLENSASRLLGRMTNGRMSVRFETQRQTVKGEVSETLDLRISDELGERPYEMFSGGEAFRINFAVRVALSQLLANRANARLQTLFIDEGFGTQDAAGRERLVEAIRSIQDDFELIVAITHIDELKDAFPARIDVVKTPEAGSRAQIA